MANGDISQRLVSSVRDYLNDHQRKIIPTDDFIYAELTDQQDMIMTEILSSRLIAEYPLIANQESYELDDKIIQVTGITFNSELDFEPEITYSKTTVDDDIRKITLSGYESFVTGRDMMYIEYFVGPNEFDAISRTNDPILPQYLHHLLIKLILSNYRDLFPAFEPYDQVKMRIAKKCMARKGYNKSQTLKISTGINF